MTQAQLKHERHRDIAEHLLTTTENDGFPNLQTDQLLKALAHAVLALVDAKGE
jgi:hypothetical protein